MISKVKDYEGYEISIVYNETNRPEFDVRCSGDSGGGRMGLFPTLRQAEQFIDRKNSAAKAFKPFKAIRWSYARNIIQVKVNSIAKNARAFNITEKGGRERISLHAAETQLFPDTLTNRERVKKAQEINSRIYELGREIEAIKKRMEHFPAGHIEGLYHGGK